MRAQYVVVRTSTNISALHICIDVYTLGNNVLTVFFCTYSCTSYTYFKSIEEDSSIFVRCSDLIIFYHFFSQTDKILCLHSSITTKVDKNNNHEEIKKQKDVEITKTVKELEIELYSICDLRTKLLSKK